MENEIYEKNELHDVLRTVSFIIFINLGAFLMSRLVYVWSTIIIGIILCVVYFRGYYIK